MARLSHTAAWEMFVEWCQSRGLKPLPANPWTVAAYARWCETRHKYKTIMSLMKAIAKEHVIKSRKRPDRDPMVTKVLATIRERQAQRQAQKAQQAALFRAEDFAFEGPRPGAPKAPAKPKEGKKGTALKRALAATPKLVSRRPSLT